MASYLIERNLTLEKVVKVVNDKNPSEINDEYMTKNVDSVHIREDLSDVIDGGISYLSKYLDEYDSYEFNIRIYDMNSKIYSDTDLNSDEFYESLMNSLGRAKVQEDIYKAILNHVKWLELSINLKGDIIGMRLYSPAVSSPFCEGLAGGQFKYNIGDIVQIIDCDTIDDERYEVVALPSTYWDRFHPLAGDYGYKLKNIQTGEIIDQDECYLDYALTRSIE